ncbi:hypothetical protein [Roseospira marina]|uniref:hypothetical protein n=1 Tax=Roseospira marina TaxID=140057 RepID=UPI0017C9BB40|nr:hypothetical protein [Roseospira marina]MBB4314123.1 hypothetical protein [Roseospira marina]MBB5087284.1 hypothetical protein [Roseospira marina]
MLTPWFSCLLLRGAVVGLAAGLITGAGPAGAAAPPPTSLISDDLVNEIRGWLDTPVVDLSIAAKNEATADLRQSDVDRLDRQWRAEVETDDQPLITEILSSPLSNYLLQIQAGSLGLYAEIFVINNVGLNVGQSAITSDYWQGDEAKFQKTYDVGPDAVFIDAPEFHEGTQTWRAQLSLTINDDLGRKSGVATVEINLTELSRRK